MAEHMADSHHPQARVEVLESFFIKNLREGAESEPQIASNSRPNFLKPINFFLVDLAEELLLLVELHQEVPMLVVVREGPFPENGQPSRPFLNSVGVLGDEVLVGGVVLAHVEVPGSCLWFFFFVKGADSGSEVYHLSDYYSISIISIKQFNVHLNEYFNSNPFSADTVGSKTHDTFDCSFYRNIS